MAYPELMSAIAESVHLLPMIQCLRTPVNGHVLSCRFHGQDAYGREFNWTPDVVSKAANPNTKVSTVSWCAHSLLARYQGT